MERKTVFILFKFRLILLDRITNWDDKSSLRNTNFVKIANHTIL